MPLMKSQARNVGKQLQIKQELLLQFYFLMNFYYVYVSLWDTEHAQKVKMLCVKGNLINDINSA